MNNGPRFAAIAGVFRPPLLAISKQYIEIRVYPGKQSYYSINV